jgi:hypothetical protein
MRLSEKQQDFARHVADLIHHIYASGYACTFGHAYRCQECPVGRPQSVHKSRLAVDLNLFKDGKYLTDTEAYRAFGEYWEALGEWNRWGGAWDDGNHFSYEHNGVK